MSDPKPEGDDPGRAETEDTADQSPAESGTPDQSLTEEDYALGETSDPDGASRDEPAGEDYAGSGF